MMALKGKTAFIDLPEYILSRIQAYHLNVGHEIIHSRAIFGTTRGKFLFAAHFIGTILPLFILGFIATQGLHTMLGDIIEIPVVPDMGLSLLELLPLLILPVLLALIMGSIETQHTKPWLFDRKGWVNSYDVEEVVAEIGAVLLLSRSSSIVHWPSYSLQLIASRLSQVDPERRTKTIELAWHDAKRRIEGVMPTTGNDLSQPQ